MDFIGLVNTTHYQTGWDLLVSVGELFYRDQEFYRAALKIEGQNSFSEYFHESMAPIVSFFLREMGRRGGGSGNLYFLFLRRVPVGGGPLAGGRVPHDPGKLYQPDEKNDPQHGPADRKGRSGTEKINRRFRKTEMPVCFFGGRYPGAAGETLPIPKDSGEAPG